MPPGPKIAILAVLGPASCVTVSAMNASRPWNINGFGGSVVDVFTSLFKKSDTTQGRKKRAPYVWCGKRTLIDVVDVRIVAENVTIAAMLVHASVVVDEICAHGRGGNTAQKIDSEERWR